MSLLLVSCNLPIQIETPAPAAVETSPAQPVSTESLEQAEAPAPLDEQPQSLTPAVVVENADRAYFYGDWELALDEYLSAYETSPDPEIRTAALLGVGRTRYQIGAYEESVGALQQIIGNYPEFSQLAAVYFALAQTYEALERYTEAAEAYANYLNFRPGIIDAYIQERRGDALVAAGNHLAAIDVYQAARQAPQAGDSLVEIKIANAYAAIGDHSTALVAYQDIYTRTTNDYTRANLDFRMGQSYMALGETENAYAAYLDAVENYPLSFDSYQALILLVEAGYPVNEFDRGLVDYFAGQYNLSIAAFDRYLGTATERAGTVYYYEGLAYLALDEPDAAIASLDVVMASYDLDENWDEAWEEKAFIQWAYLDQFDAARETLLAFVDQNPLHARAPQFLFDAARIAERAGDFGLAASIWERIPPEYPASDLIPRAIFLAGISYYRAGDYASALSSFQWLLDISVDPANRSAAFFWMAKSQQAAGDQTGAQTSFQQAVNADPTGYYSERARDLVVGRAPFDPPLMYDLAFDAAAERLAAEEWMRAAFSIPAEVDLSGIGPLSGDPRVARGTELWTLGLYDEARLEFESLRADISGNPMDCYRLANYLVDLGLYRSAIFAARQVLSLHGMSDAETMNAPAYFNHLRFGSYYRELVLPAAQANDFHPLFLFSVLRQESLFEGFVHSSAGARGLMQIIPGTGEGIAANLGWPPGYTAEDLYRPRVSITFGADYLDSQRDYFDGDLYAALAAYNGGPGNALLWKELSGGDPDLFLEIIRFDETRNYIKGIYEVFSIYRRLYDRTP